MKKFMILLFILLCCGCNAKYEINIIDDNISDSLTVSYERTGETISQINDSFSDSFYAIGRSSLYDFKNMSTDNDVIINLNYDYGSDFFKSANIPNSCFEHFSFLSDDDKYYLFAGGTFKCSYYAYEYLDSLDIIINTNHNVIENNADEVVDDKYVWHINKEDNNQEIKFIISKVADKKKKKINYKLLLYISSAVGLFLLLIVVSLVIRHRHVNKI